MQNTVLALLPTTRGAPETGQPTGAAFKDGETPSKGGDGFSSAYDGAATASKPDESPKPQKGAEVARDATQQANKRPSEHMQDDQPELPSPQEEAPAQEIGTTVPVNPVDLAAKVAIVDGDTDAPILDLNAPTGPQAPPIPLVPLDVSTPQTSAGATASAATLPDPRQTGPLDHAETPDTNLRVQISMTALSASALPKGDQAFTPQAAIPAQLANRPAPSAPAPQPIVETGVFPETAEPTQAATREQTVSAQATGAPQVQPTKPATDLPVQPTSPAPQSKGETPVGLTPSAEVDASEHVVRQDPLPQAQAPKATTRPAFEPQTLAEKPAGLKTDNLTQPTATETAAGDTEAQGPTGSGSASAQTPTAPAPAAPSASVAAQAVASVETGPTLPEASFDLGLTEVRGGDGLRLDRAGLPTLDPATLARPEFARFVTNQVADMIRAGSDGALEVTLRPEELGRVSLTLNADGTTMNVSLTAERAETLDLLKRNISLLERDLADLGYSDLAFDFGDAPDGNVPGESRRGGAGIGTELADETVPDMAQIPQPTLSPRTAEGGMDLRL